MAVNRKEFLKVFDETIGNRKQDQKLLKSYKEYAEEFLLKLQTNNFPLYGLIGEYGTGKSTFLNAVKHCDEKNSQTKNIRITFEARKYPDRKELWDAFIIEVLSQTISHLTNEGNKKDVFQIMDTIKKEMIKGIYNQDDKNIRKSNTSKEVIAENVDSIIPDGIPFLSNGKKNIASFVKSTIQDSKESVSRLFDYEHFFKQNRERIIGKYYDQFDKVYIIIEDIDRCEPDGMIFLETLSYFMNTISKEDYMMDKMTCIVSIGNGFLNDHRHLINKAITSYEIFNMRTENVLSYFHDIFLTKKLGLTDEQKKSLKSILSYYLNIYGDHTRSIREIKYLFKKIIPHILYKKSLLLKKGIRVTDNVILSMIILNFSLFFRKNMTNNDSVYKETFQAKDGLIYCKPQQRGLYCSFLNSSTGLNHIHSFKPNFLNQYVINLYPNISFSSDFNLIMFDDQNTTEGEPIKLQQDSRGPNRDGQLFISTYRLLNE